MGEGNEQREAGAENLAMCRKLAALFNNSIVMRHDTNFLYTKDIYFIPLISYLPYSREEWDDIYFA